MRATDVLAESGERVHRPRRRRQPRRPWRAWIVLLLAAAICFALGVAVGQTLDDRQQPGGTITRVRTLQPGTVVPAPETVTVTSSTP